MSFIFILENYFYFKLLFYLPINISENSKLNYGIQISESSKSDIRSNSVIIV
jgi:hypothetical protein